MSLPPHCPTVELSQSSLTQSLEKFAFRQAPKSGAEKAPRLHHCAVIEGSIMDH